MSENIAEKDKQRLSRKISDVILKRKSVIFAYIYGSFCEKESFNDIDVGIFISDNERESALKVELGIEKELENVVHVPVDVRILNGAPISFVYNVIRNGMLIVDKDIDMRADTEGIILKKYFDFRHLRNEYLREVANAPL